MTIEFQAWPKIARLNRDMIVTEKLDGTNAAVIITDDYDIAAQSRKRLITPGDDNYGFARWVLDNADALKDALGPGRHFGEWWGSGIQRGYGLPKGEKRFSLFNVGRYADADLSALPNVGLVPVLYQGPFDVSDVDDQLWRLQEQGSFAAPGFLNPEGVVVFHVAANQLFKATINGDEAPKGLAA